MSMSAKKAVALAAMLPLAAAAFAGAEYDYRGIGDGAAGKRFAYYD